MPSTSSAPTRATTARSRSSAGLPYDLPLGIELYQRYAGSGVTIDDVPPARRTTFTDHKLRSKDDAENLVIALERGQIE